MPPPDRSTSTSSRAATLAAAIAVTAAAAATLWRLQGDDPEVYAPPPSFIGEAREGCKPGAAGAFLEAHPPPSPAHAATCHALAGDAEAARQALADLDDGERREAAGVVFGLIHPIADAGDEEAAGIGMELVLELWPENYQARYHAGLFAYGRGRDAEARAHLERFVAEYRNDDGFRQRALRALAALDAITRGETTARPALSAH